MRDSHLLYLLERIKKEIEGYEVFISTREKMHPCGIEMHKDLLSDISKAIEEYKNEDSVLP